MASKKVNPEALAKLAKQKTASAADFRKAEEASKKITKGKKPTTSDTTPPSPPTTIDWSTWRGDTTTTTVPPTTTTTTIPTTTVPPVISVPTTPPLSQRVLGRIDAAERELFGPYTESEIADIKTGKKKKQPFWKKAISVTFNNPITEATVLRPLKTLAFVGRIGVSTFEESAQLGRKLVGKEERYEATDYIPKHKQTGKPIAGVGDPIVRNWEEIINTPIDDDTRIKIESATTEKERNRLLNEATTDVVKKNARTSSGSFTEWARQIGTPTEFKDYGFGDITEVQVGRQLVEAGKVSPTVGKWIDRGVGFTGDVVLDPTTYLSMGTTTAAKIGTRPLAGAAETLVEIAADDFIRLNVKQVTKKIKPLVAQSLGEDASSKVVEQTTRAVVAEAAQLFKGKVATGEITGFVGRPTAFLAEKADDYVRQASRRWSAVAPRREVGAGARQSTAAMVSDLRDEAQQVINSVTDVSAANTARVRSAYEFVNTITDDVIKDIAVRGNAAIVGDVARVLNTPGGLRWGIGARKITLPGTQRITPSIGKAFTLPRQALAATETGRKVIGATTRVGKGGLFGDEYIFNWRTGLRSGYNAQTGKKLTGAEAVEAIKRLSEDQVYRALKKTTSQTIKQGVDSIFRESKYKKYNRTVHTLLADNTVDWNKTADEIARATGRDVAEAEFALRIRDLRNEFSKIVDDLSAALGGNIQIAPENWFPQALSDKAVIWLNKNTPAARQALRALGLDAPPAAGKSIADELIPGMKWFGHSLTDADIEQGVSRLNFLANNPAGGVQKFVGEFFDTNASSAIEKWARKFSDDYAFLRNALRGQFEYAGGGSRAVKPTVLTSQQIDDIRTRAITRFLNGLYLGDLDSAVSDFGEELAKSWDLGFDDVDIIIQAVKDDIAEGVGWMVDDAGNLAPEAVEQRLNYHILQRRLDKLAADPEEWQRLSSIVTGRRSEVLRQPRTAANADKIENQEYVLGQIQQILDAVSDEMIVGGKNAEEFIRNVPDFLAQEIEGLLGLFSQSPERFAAVVDNIDPRMLRTMVNMTEDAFVQLDNSIVPDLFAQREVAQMFYNVRRLKEPKFQNAALRFLRNFNRFIKTWVTSTPGFHLRNFLSNAWQMIATGANPTYLNEGLGLMNEWNRFVKANTGVVKDIEKIVDDILNLPAGIDPMNPRVGKLARQLNWRNDDVLNAKFIMDDLIARRAFPRNDWRALADFVNIRTRLEDPELLIDRFLTEWDGVAKFSPAEQEAFRETMMWTGAAGFGDVEEVFGAVIPSRMGITGAEVPVRTSPVGRAASKTSEIGGAIPRLSRNFGAKIENYSRFMLTYDGIRQGFTPEQSAARTARYLVDYEDLTKFDEYAKLIFPFWMWMSRNLPVQTANMFMNPKAYAVYQNFRENFEDKDGNNALLPSYLKDAGIFKAPFGENIYLKPDFGFPGAGSPSPLQSGITDVRSLLSAIPAVGVASALAGEELYSGRPLEGIGERAQEVIGQTLPPLGVAGRYISAAPYIGAGSDWGPLGGLQDILGVQGPRESGQRAQTTRALASLLGIPLTTIGPDQENIALYEILDRLQPFLEQVRLERGGG